jgi:hypothetical protein
MARRGDLMAEEIERVIPNRQIIWPVVWSAVWVGALAILTFALMVGLVGFAIGAHEAASPLADWRKVGFISLVFNIGGAFFASVVGGWIAARLAGLHHSEPAAVHGAIAWLLTVPLVLALAALGGTARFGGWYAGLAGPPLWVVTAPIADPQIAEALRNASLAALAVLVMGLAGSVIGGWMASGEPMTFAYYRRRPARERAARAV